MSKVNFFNVDAKRLAAGYRRGAENTERREKWLTELYWAISRFQKERITTSTFLHSFSSVYFWLKIEFSIEKTLVKTRVFFYMRFTKCQLKTFASAFYTDYHRSIICSKIPQNYPIFTHLTWVLP